VAICGHLIDEVFVSRPDIYQCRVFTRILKTKHSAVLVTSERDLHYVPLHQYKRKLLLYDLRAHNIDR